jgi:hypothetical protein
MSLFLIASSHAQAFNMFPIDGYILHWMVCLSRVVLHSFDLTYCSPSASLNHLRIVNTNACLHVEAFAKLGGGPLSSLPPLPRRC